MEIARIASRQGGQKRAVRCQKKLLWISWVILLALVFVLVPARPVKAVPLIPHQFYGNVYLGGAAAPDGTTIIAKIGGVSYATASTTAGQYGYSPIFYVPGNDTDTSQKEGGVNGDTIVFYIDAYQATSYTFAQGVSTRLDFNVPAGNALALTLTVSGQAADYAATGVVKDYAGATVAGATVSIAWGDGASSEVVSQSNGTFSATHTYAASQGYTVTAYAAKSGCVKSTSVSVSITVGITPTLPVLPGGGGGAPAAPSIEKLEAMTSEEAAKAVEQMSDQDAAELMAGVATAKAATIFESMATGKAATIFESMAAGKAATIFESMAAGKAATIFENMAADKAATIFENMTTDKAATTVENMASDKGAAVLEKVATDKGAAILEKVAAEKAASVMEQSTTSKLTQLISAMSEKALTERLPGLSPGKLYSIEPAVLFKSLPNAPTEQLVSESPPQPPPQLTAPATVYTTPSGAKYLAIATISGEWVTVVGTPAPVDKLLIKTKKALSNVGTTIEVLSKQPMEVLIDLPSERIVRAYVKVTLENAAPEDIEVGHMTFKLEKEWLTQNSIHKWSVVLSTWRTDFGKWVFLPTKRVKEDDSYVYYTAPISHFSVFAITGSRTLPSLDFKVSNLAINPGKAKSGEAVNISADVTNLSSAPQIYSAVLWIDNVVETGETVSLQAGETKAVSFTVVRDAEADYNVRFDRLSGSFSVTKLIPTPTPTPTLTPTPTPTPTLTPTPALTPTPTPTPTLTPTPTPVPPPVPPVNWWLIGGIIIAVIIVGMAVWLIISRRRV